MKIFLTGATGFIGSHLARILTKEKHTVYALVRPTAAHIRIKDIASLKIIPGGLENLKYWKGELKKIKPDVCFHLAWHTVPGEYLHNEKNIKCLQLSSDLALAAADAGCPYFVGVGSCFEYDWSKNPLSESMPVKPRTLYAATKLSFWLFLEKIGVSAGMQTAWARLFYQFGPYEDSRRLVPSLILALLKQKPALVKYPGLIKDFLYIEDVASALAAIGKSKLTGIVNIGSGKGTSIQAIASTIENLLGCAGRIQYGGSSAASADEPPSICADIARLQSHCKWQPRYNTEEGLEKTLQWWQNQKEKDIILA